MTTKQIQDTLNHVRKLAYESRLRDAYQHLINLSEKMLTWELTSVLKQQEDSYKLMLDYAAKGATDPERDKLHDKLREDILATADRIERKALLRDTPTLFYNTLRFEAMQRQDSIAGLIEQYRSHSSNNSLLEQIADTEHSKNDDASQRQREAIEKRIFDRVWVSYPLAPEAVDSLSAVLADVSVDTKFKRLLVGALLLGEIQTHDQQRLGLMIDAMELNDDIDLRMNALVALVLSLTIHNRRRVSSSLKQRIDAMREVDWWDKALDMVFVELIKTSETERIVRKIREEVLPEMMKLRPEITSKLSKGDAEINIGDMEANPEWAEKLEKSGLGDKLRELSEIQEDGGDVFMGTFSMLKTFPFFNDVVNWFRPFDPENSSLESVEEFNDILELLTAGAGFCDNDRYSLALSMTSMPEQQRMAMRQQIEANSQQLAEMRLSKLTTSNTDYRDAINNYVRSLYRFFKLFRRKGEFNDPFNALESLTNTPLLSKELHTEANVKLAAEFYLKIEFFAQALNHFKDLLRMQSPSAELYQKIGYCYQRMGNNDKALEYFNRAELIDAENQWTMRRMAACYRSKGDIENALKYYRRLEKLNPNDFKLTLIIGHCLIELGHPEEAIEYFYKAEFLNEKSTKPLRPLAWCLLLTRNFAKAQSIYDHIMTLDPIPADYLNMGHLQLATGDFKSAANFYNMSIETGSGDVESFITSFNADRNALIDIGIEPTLLPLVIDTLLYQRDY